VEPAELEQELREHPNDFTPWFKLALERVRAVL
jgi:hypothetical protein